MCYTVRDTVDWFHSPTLCCQNWPTLWPLLAYFILPKVAYFIVPFTLRSAPQLLVAAPKGGLNLHLNADSRGLPSSLTKHEKIAALHSPFVAIFLQDRRRVNPGNFTPSFSQNRTWKSPFIRLLLSNRWSYSHFPVIEQVWLCFGYSY